MNNDQPEQPTPDSLILWAELQDAFSTPEWNEFVSAQAAQAEIKKRSDTVCQNVLALFELMPKRVDKRLDITNQVTALRWELREAGIISKQSVQIAVRLSKSLAAVSDKISALINEE